MTHTHFNILSIPPKIWVDHLGLPCALFLTNIFHEMEDNHIKINNKLWIKKTKKEWGQQIYISERQIAIYIKKLKNKNLIFIEKLSKEKFNRTNFISINYKEIEKLK